MGRRKDKMSQNMGPSSRPAKVGEVIRKEISNILTHGEVREPRLADAFTTVTEVRVTPDLQHAIAYVSVFSDEAETRNSVLDGLKSASKEIQKLVGSRLTMRYTPLLRFELDESIQEGAKIESLLKEINTKPDVVNADVLVDTVVDEA